MARLNGEVTMSSYTFARSVSRAAATWAWPSGVSRAS